MSLWEKIHNQTHLLEDETVDVVVEACFASNQIQKAFDIVNGVSKMRLNFASIWLNLLRSASHYNVPE
jgi:hypothetical protein